MMIKPLNINLEQLIGLRHWLHAHPEISRQEHETSKHMRSFLEKYASPDEIILLDGAGFAVVFNGAAPGNTVLIRAELDALPIHEVNEDLRYRSVYDGVGHKCGHDGHLTILAGIAQTLADRPAKGRVVLLFQPDEETGTGARGCKNHPNFKRIAPDFAFALHSLPGFPKGEVVCKVGTFASAVKYVAVRMVGKGSHSAQPETGINPAFAMAELTLKAREIQSNFDGKKSYALIVPIFSQMGVQSSGVSPPCGEVHFTLRSGKGDILDDMWRGFSDCAETIAAKYGLAIEFETLEEFDETPNGQVAFEMVRNASTLAGLEFNLIDEPFRWGEDFGELTRYYKGAMFGMGAGIDHPPLHDPEFDFVDDLLEPSIEIFTQLIAGALGESQTRAV